MANKCGNCGGIGWVEVGTNAERSCPMCNPNPTHKHDFYEGPQSECPACEEEDEESDAEQANREQGYPEDGPVL